VNRTVSTALVGVVLVGAVATATPAQASTLSAKALKIAAAQKGDAYKYGATGPSKFDCSGLTLYSFKHAGKTIPRTAQGQYNKSKHISAGSRKPGDLVFFGGTRSVYHVGVYAGSGKIWHAPKPGSRVKLEKIWTKSVHYGRFS
jgi:cell wall-associated NlpC family hydrolase